jgi:hypothetical protein
MLSPFHTSGHSFSLFTAAGQQAMFLATEKPQCSRWSESVIRTFSIATFLLGTAKIANCFAFVLFEYVS